MITDDNKLVLSSNKGQVIGLSKVGDYIYHPNIYKNVSLYDWIQLYEKYPMLSNKKNINSVKSDNDTHEFDYIDDEKCNFIKDRPQNERHMARMKADYSLIVANFLGGSLPRADKGDCEYYACTMLTLFKPWRSGKDLKSELDS